QRSDFVIGWSGSQKLIAPAKCVIAGGLAANARLCQFPRKASGRGSSCVRHQTILVCAAALSLAAIGLQAVSAQPAPGAPAAPARQGAGGPDQLGVNPAAVFGMGDAPDTY